MLQHRIAETLALGHVESGDKKARHYVYQDQMNRADFNLNPGEMVVVTVERVTIPEGHDISTETVLNPQD